MMARAKIPSWYRFVTVDVFTTEVFDGNPLAIVHVPKDSPITQEQKQAIAREFNLSETVFLHEDTGDPRGRRLDIFVPLAELPFAGHPTIGTLWYIATQEYQRDECEIKLLVKAGTIEATFTNGKAEALIPHNVHIHSTPVGLESLFASQPRLEKALGAGAGNDNIKRKDSFPVVSIVKGMTFALIELPSVDEHLSAVAVSSLEIPGARANIDPDWETTILASFFYVLLPSSSLSRTEAGSEATAAKGQQEEEKGSLERAFRLRTRLIQSDIGEDPATGSASCALAAYLALQGLGDGVSGQPGRTYAFEMQQGVEMGRRSTIRVRIELDGEDGSSVKRVWLSGEAVVVSEGRITSG